MKTILKNILTTYFICAVLTLGATPAFSQMSISVNIAPPPLQVYDQPACPDDGYIWTPGYWAYGDNAYYWVPGEWAQPPESGDLWTPPYWGSDGSTFIFYPGYWGQNVGYYGGINYGYGYGGNGYHGGRWQGGNFSYNTAVNNVNSSNFHHTYADRSAINNNASRVSYNGGHGGVQVRPTSQQQKFSNEHHAQPGSAPQPKAMTQSQPPTEQKAEPKQEMAQAPQPEHQQQQPAPQQQARQQEPAQAPQPEHQQQQSAPPQASHPQGQPQPKQEAKPSQQSPQQDHDKGPSAQPDQKSGNGQNNGQNH